MEFIGYLFVAILCAWALYWSVLNSGRRPGTPITGFFKYRETVAKPPERGLAAPRDITPERPGRWTGSR
jgi:hypothetical protein